MSATDVQALLDAADEIAGRTPPPPPPKPPGALRTIADMGVKAAQGVVDLGQSAVGAASLATGGLAGKGMRAIGYDPARTNDILAEYLSPAQREAEAQVQGADGFVDTLEAMAKNPRAIAGSIAESLPGMLGIGGVTKMVAQRIALRAAAPFGGITTEAGKKAAQEAIEKASTRLLATSGAAEGAQSAGQIADQAQAAGREYSDYAGPAIASGVATGAITLGAGKLVGDPTTALFSGAKSTGAVGSLPARVAKSIVSEGALQEMPQSAEEQVMTNLAMGEPDVTKGVANQAASGLVVGGAMGAGEGAFAPHHANQAAAGAVRAQKVPEVGTLSAAANVGLEGQAKDIENAPPPEPVAQPAPVIDPIISRIGRLSAQDREDALHAYNVVQRDDLPKGVRQYNSKLLDKLLAKIEEEDADKEAQKNTPRLTYDTTPTGTMIAGDEGVRPETHADVINRAQVQSEADAENQRRIDLGMAPIKPAAPVVDASIQGESISNPAPQNASTTEGTTITPPVETAPAAATPSEETATRAPDTKAMGAFKSAEDAQAYISQQRRSGGTVSGALVLPNEDGTFGVATKDHPDYAKAEAFKKTQDQRAAGILEGDILSKSGEPFKSKLPASNAAKKAGDTHEVAPVKGGFVARLKEWQRFPENTNTLGIPRADMPQVKTEHHGALVNFLNARGVEHQTEEVDPNTLKPTQAEYSPQRVEAVGKAVSDSDRSILVSSDGHVLDGHHQWLAAGANGEPVKVIKLSKPAAEVLPLMKEFPSAQTSEGAEHAAHEQGTITEAAKEAKAPAADESAKGSGEAPGPDTRADRAGDDGGGSAAAVTKESKGEPHAAEDHAEKRREEPAKAAEPAAAREAANRRNAGQQGDQGVLTGPAARWDAMTPAQRMELLGKTQAKELVKQRASKQSWAQLSDGWHRTVNRLLGVKDSKTAPAAASKEAAAPAAPAEPAKPKHKAPLLRAAGEKLAAEADAEASRDRNTNTARRARMAAGAEAQARAREAIGKTMVNLADAIEAGKRRCWKASRRRRRWKRWTAFCAARWAIATAPRTRATCETEREKGRPADAEDVKHAKLLEASWNYGGAARETARGHQGQEGQQARDGTAAAARRRADRRTAGRTEEARGGAEGHRLRHGLVESGGDRRHGRLERMPASRITQSCARR
jgi:hypothetical protein